MSKNTDHSQRGFNDSKNGFPIDHFTSRVPSASPPHPHPPERLQMANLEEPFSVQARERPQGLDVRG